MTSTPVLDINLLDSQMQHFTVELSEIPRSDSKLELDIEESIEVNSEEIVALSPSFEAECLARFHSPTIKNSAIRELEHFKTTEHVIENSEHITDASAEIQVEKECSNNQISRKTSTSASKKDEGSQLSGGCIYGRMDSTKSDNVNTPLNSEACNLEQSSNVLSLNLANSTKKLATKFVSKRVECSSQTKHTSKQHRKDRLSGLFQVKEAERKQNNVSLENNQHAIEYLGLPDDILANDDIPKPKYKFPKAAVLMKWTKCIKTYQDYLSSIGDIPYDVLEDSD